MARFSFQGLCYLSLGRDIAPRRSDCLEGPSIGNMQAKDFTSAGGYPYALVSMVPYHEYLILQLRDSIKRFRRLDNTSCP